MKWKGSNKDILFTFQFPSAEGTRTPSVHHSCVTFLDAWKLLYCCRCSI